jgi:hypothetical protein
MLNWMQYFAMMHLPFGLLSTVREIKLSNSSSTAFSLHDKSPHNNAWFSIATSSIYISPVHKDEDAFLSCIAVSYVKMGTENVKNKYVFDMPIVVYFCCSEFMLYFLILGIIIV